MYEPQINQAIQRMEEEARKLGIQHGVGGIVVQLDCCAPEVRLCIIERVDRDPREGENFNQSTNYLGVAFMKCAYSWRTGMPSGLPFGVELKRGEAEFRGCIPIDISGGKAFFFFSGSSEDEDAQIADAGINAFLEEQAE